MDPSVLLFLCLLSAAGSLPPPRTSVLLNSTDRSVVFFSLPDVLNTTTLLLSNDGSTLYVGARDALLSLDVSQSDVINLKKKVAWSPTERHVDDCRFKVKNPMVDCTNFIRVLQQINSTHLYTCGSHAFSPQEAYVDTDTFSLIQQGSGKGRCPFSPAQRNTALAVDGELFTATTSDFRGEKPLISRHLSKDGRPDVSQDASVKVLEEPTFISSSLDTSHRKLYFFFNEVGSEFRFIDELRIARVAQVCKDDVGGQRTLQKKWTSFAKAPLLCHSPKSHLFPNLQDVFTLQSAGGSDDLDTLFFGVFSAQWSVSPESAVCVFKLQDVRKVFSDHYRTFDMQSHELKLTQEKRSYLGKCGLSNASDSELEEVRKTFLTRDSVRPVGGGPIIVSSDQQYRRVAAMTTRATNGKQYTVLFLLTESGFLHKVVRFDHGAQVIEEVQVFTQPQLFETILLSSSKGVLYVGTSEGVAAVPVARCSTYRTCSQCVLARDPFCGWSRTRRVCTRVQDSPETLAQDLEDVNVDKECQGQRGTVQRTEVYTDLNEVVTLRCQKPSNLATLTWTSPRFSRLSEKLFILLADGAMSFLASDATVGIYNCVAEEGQHKEVVASYCVRQMVSPRAIMPQGNNENHKSTTVRRTPPTSTVTPPQDADGDVPKNEDDPSGTSLKVETDYDESGPKTSIQAGGVFLNPGATNNIQDREGTLDDPHNTTTQRSYYPELVVVSILLAVCFCILMASEVHRRRTDPKIKPLDSPEDPDKTE
ncbi:semaphorin-4B [Antennarius striatus]|uniref:semaphorin-4B n=1 Tax=Antennarius striatus TaxID=241820 RepID=UPI0035AED929